MITSYFTVRCVLLCGFICCFFFFKQKTAYEMRISDWSSDVCSSDLLVHGESIPNMTDDELFEMRKKFGLLFQDGALFGSMDIYDNTAFPLRQHTDKSEEEIGEIVNRRLNEVGLSHATDTMTNEPHGGLRKLPATGRAPGGGR